MADLLYEVALEFKKLTHTGYRIVLGRQGKSFELQVRFPRNSFFHLTGLQHLEDITFSSTNKERIYKDILQKKLTFIDIEKSVFFKNFFIQERLSHLKYLEEILDSAQLVFLINPREYLKYTKIYANYLCVYALPNNKIDTLYLFLVKDVHSKVDNACKACSFFKKHDTDYTRGTAQAKLLLSEKILNLGTPLEKRMEIYRNPIYKEEHST